MKKSLSDAEIGQILAESNVQLAIHAKERIRSWLFKPKKPRIRYSYALVMLVIGLFLFTNSNVRSAIETLSMGVIDQSELPPTPLPEDINNYPMDVFKETPINDADIAKEIPFEVLKFTAIPDDFSRYEQNKVVTKSYGNGIVQRYQTSGHRKVFAITQFQSQGRFYIAIDRTKSDVRQLYDNEAVCYVTSKEHNTRIIEFAYQSYKVDIQRTLSCNELYSIAGSIR